MSLEFFGKLFFAHIRPIFFYCFLFIPFVISGSYLWGRHASQQHLEMRLAEVSKKEKKAVERKRRKERFIERYSHSDPFFLDQQIEALTFLTKEAASLRAMIDHPALADPRIFQQRLQFLKETNRLAFIEEKIRSSSRLKETEEKQRHPVQMDESDLQRLLTYIEDIPVGQNEPISKMPQLLIRSFKMKKMENPLHSEIYEVEMKLLKREWTR